jgi:CheY-like chemotaxis protein
MMSRKIEEKKLDYIQCIAPEIENVNINSEKSTITQILLNLIKNALLNIERGELKVECMFNEDDKSFIKVCVHDEGKSIGHEEARRINKILGRKDISNKNCDYADSSNLIICKILTEKLGGKIWVASEDRVGNSVYFTFRIDSDNDEVSSFEEEMEISDYNSDKDAVKLIPSMNCNEAPFANKPIAVEAIQSEGEQCCSNILLVDDNYFNIEVLQSLIEVQLQFRCDSAFNGLEAVNKVKERNRNQCCSKHYKFIFMDVNMPIMDGYTASREIKRFLKKEAVIAGRDFTKVPTKIFAVTAQKEVIENEQSLFDGIILKPISIDGLKNVLK